VQDSLSVGRRAALVVPASSERMIAKALKAGADEVVLDLEDAVAVEQKDRARRAVVAALTDTSSDEQARTSIAVRINGLGTPWCGSDLAALSAVSAPVSVIVPKVESAQDIADVMAQSPRNHRPVQALIETPGGVQRVDEICAAAGVVAVIIGYADLGAALGRTRGLAAQRWSSIQDRVLIAARSAGIQAIDGPHLGVADDDDFQSALQWAAESGFDGKWVIHPRQLAAATAAFTPQPAEVNQAREVLAALDDARRAGNGAAQLDGQMLDEAIAVWARRTLAKCGDREV
jgi:citrate lyase beta subunit